MTISSPELHRLLVMRGDWFKTATGHLAFVADPSISHVDIEDIARALSRQCRYAGHLKDGIDIYSVAQHSVLVAWLVELTHPQYGYAALMHDAQEAYTQDIVRPLKMVLSEYRAIEDRWTHHLSRVFGYPNTLNQVIMEADRAMMYAERRDLTIGGIHPSTNPQCEELASLWPRTIDPWSVSTSREVFLQNYARLRTLHIGSKDDRLCR